jgi:hypothetical protein
MRVRITRRGGLAGIPLSAELDTASFDKDTAARLDAALQKVVRGASGRGAPERAAPAHPDAFTYEIALPDQGGLPAQVGEHDMPAELEPLLRELTDKGELGPPREARGT